MSFLGGMLLLCTSVALAVGGLILVQRSVPITLRRQHNDVAGFIYAVLGVVYAVLLGFMVVAVWEEWNAAAATTDEEATALSEIFWIAGRMPGPEGHHIQDLARSYARVVIDEEWPLMEHGKASPRAWDLLDEIRNELLSFDPSTQGQQILYEQGLERMRDLADARRDRLRDARQGLPALLWVVLMVGGIDVVSFTYLFGLESTLIHILMVAALALIIALALFTIASLDFPFRGDITVGPDALRQVLGNIENTRLDN
jgi:uncharacterized membrane protein YraQ (UPF0718 family)